MGWVSPTGFVDPDSKWSDEALAYDDDTGTNALNAKINWNSYLELTHAALNCDKVRIYARDWDAGAYDPDLDIDVYYDGGWNNIFSGLITKDTWVEKTIPAGEKSVTAARIKSNTSGRGLLLYEFDFREVVAAGIENKSAAMAAKMIAGKLI